MKNTDEKARCQWVNFENETYIRYHDEEWGVPVYDDHKLFEMLVLESFQAAIINAAIFLKIQHEFQSFSKYIWHWTNGNVIYENGLSDSPLSDAISKDLKKRGMKFVGTTIIYAYLQAIGVINSHEDGCYLVHRRDKLR